MADQADQRDAQCLPRIVEQTRENLQENHIQMEQLLADAGYSSGEALAYLHEQGLDAWIPNFGQFVPEREGFVFNKEENRYECVRQVGNRAFLPFKGERTDSKGYTKRTYRSSEADCKSCPLRASCCGEKTNFKKIDDSIHKEHYERMHRKLIGNPDRAKRMSRIRSKTVEPVLGTLLNFLGMRRVNTRGLRNANKHVMMSALCYNVKKLLKFGRKRCVTKVEAVTIRRKETQWSLDSLFWRLLARQTSESAN